MKAKSTEENQPGSKEPTFEEAIGRIEGIVERLEAGELTLDESLALFQEGVELSRRCQSVLDTAQRKIELLVRAADGTLRVEPLEPDEAEGPQAAEPGSHSGRDLAR